MLDKPEGVRSHIQLPCDSYLQTRTYKETHPSSHLGQCTFEQRYKHYLADDEDCSFLLDLDCSSWEEDVWNEISFWGKKKTCVVLRSAY